MTQTCEIFATCNISSSADYATPTNIFSASSSSSLTPQLVDQFVYVISLNSCHMQSHTHKHIKSYIHIYRDKICHVHVTWLHAPCGIVVRHELLIRNAEANIWNLLSCHFCFLRLCCCCCYSSYYCCDWHCVSFCHMLKYTLCICIAQVHMHIYIYVYINMCVTSL